MCCVVFSAVYILDIIYIDIDVVTWMALKTQLVTWRLDTPVATRPPRGNEEKVQPVTSSRPTLVAVIWGQEENMSRWSISYSIVIE